MQKTAIVLVPEISLTPQMLDRFISRFGKEKIAVLHSKLSIGEKYDEWNKIKEGRLRYPFAGMGTQEKYWSAKASFQADRISPVFWLRRSRNVQNKRDNTEENN